MAPDSCVIKAPAKLNLFLRILNQKKNGYHIIRSGITFLDLYDKVSVRLSNKDKLEYIGPFKPKLKRYDNDIILKVLDIFNLKKNIHLEIKITKNIPWKAGLGSASTDAASFIKGLQKLCLVNNIDNKLLSKIGADVPVCYYAQDCLATDIGNKINNIDFPKYYFVLVYPKIPLSTSIMYRKIKEYLKYDDYYIQNIYNLKKLHESDYGNDFELIVNKENKKISDLLKFLASLEDSIFSRMSGSGSCCYVVFENKDNVQKAFDFISRQYNDYWIYCAENNTNID